MIISVIYRLAAQLRFVSVSNSILAPQVIVSVRPIGYAYQHQTPYVHGQVYLTMHVASKKEEETVP